MIAGAWRVELELEAERPDPVGDAAQRALTARGLADLGPIRSGRGFLLSAELDEKTVHALAARLLGDSVTEQARVLPPGAVNDVGGSTLVVRRMAGVSDPEAQTAARAAALLGAPLQSHGQVESYRTYRVLGDIDAAVLLETGGRALANLVIEEVALASSPLNLHPVPAERPATRREVPLLEADGETLLGISTEMSLALSREEMEAVQTWYRNEGREPTDVELETIAQTWSEHCKHKTLTGPVHLSVRDADGAVVEERHYQNLLKETVFAATQRLNLEWCWSLFKDNAGVIQLAGDVGVAIKVETHNHPSALDPYGGAGTGIGGVIRDILGTGLGARPFAATDVFCVGPADFPHENLPPGTMHPNRILEGVIGGVRDYGNRMGIPTVCGTIIRHPGYVANPLVYAGCVGEIPRKYVEKEAHPGDHIVAFGGRTGRDGIHGATFSSEALHEESESADAAAVQIGDPITEKKVLDVLLEARDLDLFHALTDCGAGGFSSAVGEMGEECGAEVELSTAPLKYPGLSYWEIWISEAQERMVAAIPPDSLDEFRRLCGIHEVEMTVLGKFTDTGRLKLTWHGEVVGDMTMEFLHGGVPQPLREAHALVPPQNNTAWPVQADWQQLLLDCLAHPSILSKEPVVRQYDHEVQGATVVKPYQGAEGHGPGDGTVMKPRFDMKEGVALGCGIAPRMAELDSYAATACAIDEAIRNTVAAGGNPHRTAILDNFCWGDCRKPDRFGTLVRAAEACYDAAIAYGTPFISGKDSLNNEYRVGDEEKAIPPTLLCTAMAIVDDCAKTVTTPLQKSGNLLVLIGRSEANAGGAVASDLLGLPDSAVPCPDFETAPALFAAVHEAISCGLVSACHDLCEGGLAVAAGEMVFGAAGLGARIAVDRVHASPDCPIGARLYGETPSRFLMEVPSDSLEALGSIFRTLPWAVIGEVLDEARLELRDGDDILVDLSAEQLATANGVPR